MEWNFEGFLWWYIVFSAIGLVLIFFRDDRLVILNDIVKGFTRNATIAILHGLFLLALMPLTIPFSLGRIISKWF